MTDRELHEVIALFEAALVADKTPVFKDMHRVEQVLRILKREQERWRSKLVVDKGVDFNVR